MAESAHSAYDKAAEYFNIKVRRVPVNKEFLADVKGFKRCINGNTIMVSFFMILNHKWSSMFLPSMEYRWKHNKGTLYIMSPNKLLLYR